MTSKTYCPTEKGAPEHFRPPEMVATPRPRTLRLTALQFTPFYSISKGGNRVPYRFVSSRAPRPQAPPVDNAAAGEGAQPRHAQFRPPRLRTGRRRGVLRRQ